MVSAIKLSITILAKATLIWIINYKSILRSYGTLQTEAYLTIVIYDCKIFIVNAAVGKIARYEVIKLE
jgi:hypothetical protein